MADKMTPETQRALLHLLGKVRSEIIRLNAVVTRLERAARANRGDGEIIRELKSFRDWFLSLAAAYSRMGLSQYAFFEKWKAVHQSYSYSEVMPWTLEVPWEGRPSGTGRSRRLGGNVPDRDIIR